jgi:bifunctional non-homologous end joining protein LigD
MKRRTSTHRSPARFLARMLPGAKPAAFPGFIEPCIPTLRSAVPAGSGWLFEIKFDGYRVQLHLRAGRPSILTRGGHDWTGRFRLIGRALEDWPANDLILDGEIVVPDEKGVSNFSDLQADLAAGRKDRMVCYVFDLLFLDGFDLRAAQLIERKRVLHELMATAPKGPLLYSDHLDSDGAAAFKHACAMGLEGLVCKRVDAPYRSGRIETWLKVKCTTREVLQIVGFIPASGGTIAALYLGRRKRRRLVYAGKAGTGFTARTARELRTLLDAHAIDDPPMSVPLRKPRATWVEPVVAAEIEHRGITSDGLLRHASYKGLRGARPPEDRLRGST